MRIDWDEAKQSELYLPLLSESLWKWPPPSPTSFSLWKSGCSYEGPNQPNKRCNKHNEWNGGSVGGQEQKKSHFKTLKMKWELSNRHLLVGVEIFPEMKFALLDDVEHPFGLERTFCLFYNLRFIKTVSISLISKKLQLLTKQKIFNWTKSNLVLKSNSYFFQKILQKLFS